MIFDIVYKNKRCTIVKCIFLANGYIYAEIYDVFGAPNNTHVLIKKTSDKHYEI